MKGKEIEILLAEDNEVHALLLQEACGAANLAHITHVVKDGEEAMAFLRRSGRYKDARRPHLVLLDIHMPKKDGFEVLAEIKQDPVLRLLPVIMLSASRSEEDVLKSYAMGACSYITKPVGLRDYRKIVQLLTRYWTSVSHVPEVEQHWRDPNPAR